MIENNDVLVLIIDIQDKLLNAVYNKDLIEKRSQIFAKTISLLNLPVVITEQYPKGLGSTLEGLKVALGDAEYFEKTEFNALLNPQIKDAILSKDKKTVIVMGIESHICVYQTVESLLAEGLNVIVVADACSSRSEYEYQLAMNNFRDKNVLVKSSEMIIFALLKTAKHPNFKEIQQLIK